MVPGQAKAKYTTFPPAQSGSPTGDVGRGMIRNLGPLRARARLRRRRGGGGRPTPPPRGWREGFHGNSSSQHLQRFGEKLALKKKKSPSSFRGGEGQPSLKERVRGRGGDSRLQLSGPPNPQAWSEGRDEDQSPFSPPTRSRGPPAPLPLQCPCPSSSALSGFTA